MHNEWQPDDMPPEEPYGFYVPYQQPAQDATPTPQEDVNAQQAQPSSQAPIEQDENAAPGYAWAAQPTVQPAPPSETTLQKRTLRAGMIVVVTLLIAVILGTGLFTAGFAFAGRSTGTANTAATVAKTTVSSSTTQLSASSIQALQENAIAKVEPSVVELDVITAQGEQIGSGVIINANGDIITNNHVVSGEQSIKVVLNSGKTETAQLVGTVAADDLAVVRITPFAGMVVAQIGNSSQLSVGEEVLAIGNPLGITETATSGIVSALNRSVTESTGVTIGQAIQTDAAINPGNSGGALINLQGQLIGIPTLTAVNTQSNTAASGVSFAIPSNLVKTAIAQILQQGS